LKVNLVANCSVRDGLAAARVQAFAQVPKLLAATRGLNPVEALRVGIGMLPDNETTPRAVKRQPRELCVP